MMNPRAFLVLAVAAIAQASLVLTLCPDSAGVSVPCLNDTATGGTTRLSVPSDKFYKFSDLNISYVQDLPPDARWIDLSSNNISQIECNMPASLTFLNLSHNVLQGSWLKTPLANVAILDVSYNHDGLPWLDGISWGISLPSLNRLVFRGNQLKSLRLGFDNFPLNPLSALDLSGNPIAALTIDASVFSRLRNSSFTLTIDPTTYNQTLQACGGNANYLLQLPSIPVQYLSDGFATIYSSTTYRIVCFPGYNAMGTVQVNSTNHTFSFIFFALLGSAALPLIAFVVKKVYFIYQERYQPFHRDTVCSSSCSDHNVADEQPYRAHPTTPANV
ncbi:unnamed protein product [Aphanomyces euteiches]